jgi:hypothetical protein
MRQRLRRFWQFIARRKRPAVVTLMKIRDQVFAFTEKYSGTVD